MSLAQGYNTPTRPRIEPGSLDPESDALTTRPVHPLALTREVNLDTLSSDSSEEEIRDSGRSFQSLIVWGKKLYCTTKTKESV